MSVEEPVSAAQARLERPDGGYRSRARWTALLLLVLSVLFYATMMLLLVLTATEQDKAASAGAARTARTVWQEQRDDLGNAAALLASAWHGRSADGFRALLPSGEVARRFGLVAALVFDPAAPGQGDALWTVAGPSPFQRAGASAQAGFLEPGEIRFLGAVSPADAAGHLRLFAAARADGNDVGTKLPAVIVARDIDPGELERIGAEFGLADFGFVPDSKEVRLGIAGLDGVYSGGLTWTEPRLGRQLLWRTVPPATALFAVLIGIALVRLRSTLRFAVEIAAAARRLRDTNKELADSRQRFRDFAESASDWFWETGPDHTYNRISERVALILGAEPTAVFGRSLLDLGAMVEDRAAWDACLADIKAERAFRDLEATWISPEEKVFVFRLSGRPVIDADGTFRGYRGSGVDVTVEVLALTEARFMHEVVQDSLDSISEGFVLFSADGRLLFCNNQYRKAYPNLADVLLPGITFEEILRVAAMRSSIGDGHENIGSWIQERIERHLGKSSPDDHLLSDGRWYRISEHATPSGGIVKLLTDVTELKEREQQLANQIAHSAESEKRFRQLFDLAPFGIVLWDGDVVRFANTATAAIVGLDDADAVAGRRVADFLDGGGKVEEQLLGAAEGRTLQLSAAAVRPDGTRRDVEIGAYPAMFQTEPTVLLVLEDVTERRRVAEELQRSQKMEAIGRMAGGIAHEFNNLLTAIGGFARLAERTPDDPDRVLTSVREIAKASDRAAALTGQLLDFSRRRVTEESEPIALGDLIEDLRVFLKPLMNTGIELSIEIEDAGVHAVANPVTLNQAILNLAINARDAMPNGGRLTIALDSVQPGPAFFARHAEARPGRYAAISVTDTGFGIPPEIRDRIWEPFFTTKELGKGTGLGLSMVYSTAQAAGGVVEFETEVGVGTTFTIHLPLIDAPPPSGEGAVAESLLLEDGERLNILLVDDEAGVRAFLRMALEEAGCRVTEAEDGADALERFDEAGGLFDAVVTDVVMPRMNGAELAEALAERNPYLRMLFLTGYASRDQAASLMDRDGWQLLMKPVSPDKLVHALRDLVSP